MFTVFLASRCSLQGIKNCCSVWIMQSGGQVDNVHLTGDILEVSSSLDLDAAMISVEQEKTSDRVEHSFL